MVARIDQECIYVAPDETIDGDGSMDCPYGDIAVALKELRPGVALVLLDGVYSADVTLDISGEQQRAIWIRPLNEGKVFIEGCWFLYDTSDLILSGLYFRNTLRGAISVVGASCRTSFDHLRFENCGAAGEQSCTLFLGGSSSRNLLVNECRFVRSGGGGTHSAVMITEGDLEAEGMANEYHVVRGNSIENYDYGVLVGAKDGDAGNYGHCVEYNHVSGATICGIMAKCGDTTVRANLIERSVTGIALSGIDSVVENNRIEKCRDGIVVRGMSHNVIDNCVLGADLSAIHVASQGELGGGTRGILISHNTLAAAPGAQAVGLCVDSDAECVVEGNLCCGLDSVLTKCEGSRVHSSGNVCCGSTENFAGFESIENIVGAGDDYSSDLSWGAHGSACLSAEAVLVQPAQNELSGMWEHSDDSEGLDDEEVDSGVDDIDSALEGGLFFDQDDQEESQEI